MFSTDDSVFLVITVLDVTLVLTGVGITEYSRTEVCVIVKTMNVIDFLIASSYPDIITSCYN